MADQAVLLSCLADLAATAGKLRTSEWLRTCALLPMEEWPPAPAYKGPVVPAADLDLAVWLHAEAQWWLSQYKHDVVTWRQQLTAAEGRIAAAGVALDGIDSRCYCEVEVANRVRVALQPVEPTGEVDRG